MANSLASGAALALGMSAFAARPVWALPLAPGVVPRAPAEVPSKTATELLVLDPRVAGHQAFLRAVRPRVATLVLDSQRDGLAQIAEVLTAYPSVDVVHLVAHGEPGLLQLGATALTPESASAHSEQLRRWFRPRAPFERRPEVLLYGCSAAAGPRGQALVRTLASLTGADVAGSIDATGGAAAGANWVLEAATGAIDASLPFRPDLAQAYPGTLETFQVSNTNSSGSGSLAQAISDANSNDNGDTEVDTIVFDATVIGTITVGSTLSVTEPLTIEGPGAGLLAIDGGGTLTIFQTTNTDMTVRGLTIQNGMHGIHVKGGTLDVEACVISGNNASEHEGGAIYATSGAHITITDSALNGNSAASGGAISTIGRDTRTTITDSILSGNSSTFDGGAIAIRFKSTIYLYDSTIEGNAARAGGGIFSYSTYYLPTNIIANNSTISGNFANKGAGMFFRTSVYASFDHATITNNVNDSTSGCSAAGIDACSLAGGVSVELSNTIVAGNLLEDEAGNRLTTVDVAGRNNDSFVEVQTSLIGIVRDTSTIDSSNDVLIGVDPLLGPLANNGGLTPTHALREGSPAIDSADNSNNLEFDQRGFPFDRVVGVAADMGAFEWENDGGSGDTFQVSNTNSSGPGSLAQAVLDANSNDNGDTEVDTIVFTRSGCADPDAGVCDGTGTLFTDGTVTGTITVGSTLSVIEPVTIEGPGADLLAIDGGGTLTNFYTKADMTVRGLTIRNGMHGIHVKGGNLDVEACVISGNNAIGGQGGAILAGWGTVITITITGSVLSDNSAHYGGAIRSNWGADITIADSILSGNSANHGGAIALLGASNFHLTDSTVAGNSAVVRGGGIIAYSYERSTNITVDNSTISGNSSRTGAGVFVHNSVNTWFNHATITNNVDSSTDDCSAAGINTCHLDYGKEVYISNTIVAGNLLEDEGGNRVTTVDVAGENNDSFVEVHTSLIGKVRDASTLHGSNDVLLDVDPLLDEELAFNGGLTPTHALREGSPAIDGAGDSDLAFDQRGFPRVGVAADIGAFEWDPTSIVDAGLVEPDASTSGGSDGGIGGGTDDGETGGSSEIDSGSSDGTGNGTDGGSGGGTGGSTGGETDGGEIDVSGGTDGGSGGETDGGPGGSSGGETDGGEIDVSGGTDGGSGGETDGGPGGSSGGETDGGPGGSTGGETDGGEIDVSGGTDGGSGGGTDGGEIDGSGGTDGGVDGGSGSSGDGCGCSVPGGGPGGGSPAGAGGFFTVLMGLLGWRSRRRR